MKEVKILFLFVDSKEASRLDFLVIIYDIVELSYYIEVIK